MLHGVAGVLGLAVVDGDRCVRGSESTAVPAPVSVYRRRSGDGAVRSGNRRIFPAALEEPLSFETIQRLIEGAVRSELAGIAMGREVGGARRAKRSSRPMAIPASSLLTAPSIRR